MATYSWKEEYRLGVEHIDAQHRELFTVINRIVRILGEEDSPRSHRACAEAIKYLKSYTLHHFSDEEAFQRELGYEGYEVHKAQHEAFTASMLEMEQDMVQNDFSHDSVRRFVNALIAWLVEHIMKSDQAIVKGTQT